MPPYGPVGRPETLKIKFLVLFFFSSFTFFLFSSCMRVCFQSSSGGSHLQNVPRMGAVSHVCECVCVFVSAREIRRLFSGVSAIGAERDTESPPGPPLWTSLLRVWASLLRRGQTDQSSPLASVQSSTIIIVAFAMLELS